MVPVVFIRTFGEFQLYAWQFMSKLSKLLFKDGDDSKKALTLWQTVINFLGVHGQNIEIQDVREYIIRCGNEIERKQNDNLGGFYVTFFE